MKKKQRSPIHAYKQLLANDHDWDYAYLIALEIRRSRNWNLYSSY